jgi:alpha,alpha-trehalase
MEKMEPNYRRIEKRIAASEDCFLMLDFDGTLAPIAETPEKATLPESTRRLIDDCRAKMPVAIISGRSLEDLKRKVALEKLTYAGSHGMEWELDGKIGRFKVPAEILGEIQSVKNALTKLTPEFQGMLLEDKKMSLAIHYRLVRPIELEDFQRRVLETLCPLLDKGFEVIGGKKVFELRPKIDWDKGRFAEFALSELEHALGKRLLPLYIGDDTTDEDVFKRLPKAITIRVGKKAGSAAKYYLEDQSQVDRFLEWILGKT